MDSRQLSQTYRRAHNLMRDADGLLPQEAFDELLKFLFYLDCVETNGERPAQAKTGRPPVSPQTLRRKLSENLAVLAPWALSLWPDASFYVSDTTLLDLQQLFATVHLRSLPLDIRSTALWTFLGPDLRRALGVFPTPEDVVRSMVSFVKPCRSDVILDPACGTGTFLLESARFLASQKSTSERIRVYGIDKNPRMLLLAALNLGHATGISFHRTCGDSLMDLSPGAETAIGLASDSVDIILTNPPFGVSVTPRNSGYSLFGPTQVMPARRNKIPSEVLFLEKCLHLLRPGGRLGIVLPRSVITNTGLSHYRQQIDRIGHLTELIDLPPETFVSTGTQTTTVIAFFRKHVDTKRVCSVRICHVTNVGFDTTGRPRSGNQLPSLATALERADSEGTPRVLTHADIDNTGTLQRAATLLFRRHGERTGVRLNDCVTQAHTGRTPARTQYTEHGTFILKVGNLTGRGIDWRPRARNFVGQDEAMRRSENSRLTVLQDDILLTSSAHSARYIAQKVDILAHRPKPYKQVTFVGELIRITAVQSVDPFLLLATLRHPRVRADLQACVRGQTAHLKPEDLLDVRLPMDPRNPDTALAEVGSLLRREAALAFELSCASIELQELLASTLTPPISS